jgi:SAM-dependent methyltransferase
MYDGADVSPDMIHFCKRQWNGQGKLFWLVPESLDYWKEFEANEPESDKFSFDFIVCHSVLTHITLEDAKDLLKTLHGLLEDGGRASISVCVGDVFQIAGDWGKVVYDDKYFTWMMERQDFEILGCFNDAETRTGQRFYGVRKA